MGRAFEFRKARKLKRWSNISKTFTRLSKEIIISVKENGSDPSNNSKLRALIQNAKAANMPNDTITRNVQKGAGELEGVNYEELSYEGYGPEGVAIIMEVMTDNKNRTASNVRSIFSKNGGNLGETGSVGFMFERKGEIIFPSEIGDEDTVMMAAIESGAEDVESSEDGHIIWCIDTNLSDVAAVLESELGESQSTKLVWKPNTTTELDLEGMQKLMKLVDALEDDDDVQRVTTNFEINDEVMSQISQ